MGARASLWKSRASDSPSRFPKRITTKKRKKGIGNRQAFRTLIFSESLLRAENAIATNKSPQERIVWLPTKRIRKKQDRPKSERRQNLRITPDAITTIITNMARN